jgi:transposase, IS5 family
MRPKAQEASPQEDLFREKLTNLINLRHPLCRLAELMPWNELNERFGSLYTEKEGRPGIATRLMAGLQYLKHTYNLSDEAVVERWVENPYWQHFCGAEYFQHEFPIDPSQLTRYRKRIGAEGCEFLLKATIGIGLSSGAVQPQHLERVTVDTTVMEKAVSPPTDSALYHKARRALVKAAKQLNIELRQSYTRKSKQALRKAHGYMHARQMKRARREIKRVKVYLGRVARDLKRKLADHSVFVPDEVTVLLAKADRLLSQQRDSKHKLYAVHAPEVECIAKGKVAKKYEFGVKVSVAVTNQSNFVVGMSALPGNPYDGHTLSDVLTQIEALTGSQPQRCYADQGYRGHGVTDTEVILAHHKPSTPTQRRELKRRNAIEPVIGHMKSDGRLGRNFLKGALGDAMNAALCGAGHNLRIILRKLRFFWLWILSLYITRVSRFEQSNRTAVSFG